MTVSGELPIHEGVERQSDDSLPAFFSQSRPERTEDLHRFRNIPASPHLPQVRHDVRRIACEELVAAVPRQDDPHLSRCDLRDVPLRDYARSDSRFVEMVQDAGENLWELRRVEEQIVMNRVREQGHLLDQPALVVLLFGEVYAEGLESVREILACPEHNRRRVEPAAQMAPERHIAHELHLDRFVEEGAESLDRFGLVADTLAEGEVPILSDLGSTVLGRQIVTGRQDLDSLEEGLVPEDVLKREVVGEGPPVERPQHRGVGEDPFDFRCERDATLGLPEVQRLDPESVSGQEQPPLAFVPDCEGEHPVQFMECVGPLLFVQMDDCLRVAVRAEGVAAFEESFPEGLIVVNLPVVHDP